MYYASFSPPAENVGFFSAIFQLDIRYAGTGGAAPGVLFALLLSNEVVRLGKNLENRRVVGTGVFTPTVL